MSRLYLIAFLTSSLLYGCAGEMLVARDAPHSLALNWDRSEWRFCDTAECAKPTPKTVLLVSSPQVVAPATSKAPESVQTIMTTRTISVIWQFGSSDWAYR